MNNQSERTRPGRKSQGPKREYHLKFSVEDAAYIDREAATIGFQAFFHELVQQHKQFSQTHRKTLDNGYPL